MEFVSKRKGLNEIIDLFMQCFQKFCQMDKQPMDIGNGTKLYYAELHTIADIGKNPEINITDLANHQNITKGAVSQIVTKLEKKQIVAKFRGNNEKEIKLRLTDKGVEINAMINDFQDLFLKKYEDFYDKTSERDHELVKDLLKIIIESLDSKLC